MSKSVGEIVQMEENYRNGILPRAGGWNDQDSRDVELIMVAHSARVEREGINETIRRRKKK